MLSAEIKRKIDKARDILVGKIPTPTGQVEQITLALIYKFMSDMDERSRELGGQAKFFTGSFNKCSWKHVLDRSLSGQERVVTYGECLEKMNQNPNIPQLFRNIFKNAFLPFRDPEVLNIFLRQIDEFQYDDSESLGDAFEYLLSIMGSQGDAGQFRTPRHVIDFIVEAVGPKKTDRVLDPACGTAGFLISAYKHILKQNTKPDSNKPGSALTTAERNNLSKNFVGYDISHDMVRLSLANLYLHGFPDPRIFEYDTLGNQERWDEEFDVILANPPFMTPRGGVRPHNRFAIQANRAEVLFVDYIVEHLARGGRAGIIVPEGIIFQSANAYTALRKMLVENGYLYAVVSLPAGVFNPYSGVKTSILLIDRELAKKAKGILFVKVENDGYSLGAQRSPTEKNDLPEALRIINDYRTAIEKGGQFSSDVRTGLLTVLKEKIAEDGEYNLSSDRYRVAVEYPDSKWPIVRFNEVVTTITPPTKIAKSDFKTVGSFPIIDQSQEEISGWTNDETALILSEKPLVIFGDHTCSVKYTEKPFAQGADGIKILLTDGRLVPKFLFYLLKANPVKSDGYQRHFGKLKGYKIPLPPIEIQKQIVAEIDGFQNIISGARQVAENWKPTIEIDPNWDLIKLGEVGKIESGFGFPLEIQGKQGEKFPFLKVSDMNLPGNKMFITEWNNSVSEAEVTNLGIKVFPKGTVIFPKIGAAIATNKKRILSVPSIYDNNVMGIVPSNGIISEYLYYWLVGFDISEWASNSTPPSMRKSVVEQYAIPLPPLDVQKNVVERIEAERALVESSKKLIALYEQKTRDAIAKLWAE